MLACHFIDPDLKVDKGGNRQQNKRILILKWWFETPAAH